MTQAYQCDSCGEFRNGGPEMVLEEFDTTISDKSNRRVASELCGDCESQFRNDYTLNSGEEG